MAAFLFLFSFAAERKEAAGGIKRETDSHASDIGHWLGMTPLRGVRGDAPQGYLLRCVGIAPYEMPIEVRSVKRREGQSPSPTDVFTIALHCASPLFAYSAGDFVHSMGNCTRVRSSSVRRAAAAPSSSVQVMVSPDRAYPAKSASLKSAVALKYSRPSSALQ